MRGRPAAVLAAIGAATVLLAMPAAAPAADPPTWSCDASALRGTVLGIELEPVTANRGANGCQSVLSTLQQALPVPLAVNLATAQTALEGATQAVTAQRATSTGGLGELALPMLPELATLPALQLPEQFGAIQVPLPEDVTLPTAGAASAKQIPPLPEVPVPELPGAPTLPAPTLPDLPALPELPINPPALDTVTRTLTIDIRPALARLLPGLPVGDLLRLGAINSTAEARCSGGAPRLSGASQTSGLSVLGQSLPTDQLTERSVPLVDGKTLDPSAIDLSLITLPAGLSLGDTALVNALRSALDGLPDIVLPATLANIKITPASQETRDGILTQRALRVELSALGRTITDLVLGEARVGAGNVACASAPSVPAAALQCTKRRLVLIDVYPNKGRVQLLGAADRSLAGRTVSIVFAATGKVVAHAKISQGGVFQTTAPMPSRALRATNRARYRAVVGSEKSLNLKLMRRMIVSRMSSRSGKVTIEGRVVKPLSRPTRSIVIKLRVTCKKSVTVGEVRPARDGSFRVVVDQPPGPGAAVYRLSTRVRKNTRNRKTYPTFTLPRAVELG